jgi:hypothetical protein
MNKVDLRPEIAPPRAPLDLVAAVGAKYTNPPTFGDGFSQAKHLMRQRALEENARHEFVVGVSCSVTVANGTRFTEGAAIAPRDMHHDEARARAALLALVQRGVLVRSYEDEIAARQAKR